MSRLHTGLGFQSKIDNRKSSIFCYSSPAKMRAAAILGLGSSERDLRPFESDAEVEWLIGLPTSRDEADVVLILGGDGTVHRHLSQLVRLQLPLLIVPCGSGNDFARALELRDARDSLVAWQSFCAHGRNVRPIDLGTISPLAVEHADQVPATHDALHGARYFCCIAGVGLDGEVARRANQLPRWLRSHGGYVLSLAGALTRFSPPTMTIFTGDETSGEDFVLRSSQRTFLASFANAPFYGGGMRLAPQARLDDGHLDVCLIRKINKLKLALLFPTVYFGRHLGMREVDYFKSKRVRVTSEVPLDVYADGEFLCRTPIEVGVITSALTVVVKQSLPEETRTNQKSATENSC
jgi:diacylglycerol kinase (ATP)